MDGEPKRKDSRRLRFRVSRSAERALSRGHPWLYVDRIRDQNREGTLGELAVVYSQDNRFLAAGLYDPFSRIRMRVLAAGKAEQIDEAWWRARLQAALARRQPLFASDTTAYRLINGESDGFPGLVLDRYDKTLVLKIYTGIWLPQLPVLNEMFVQELGAEAMVLRLSRNIQELAQSDFNYRDGSVLTGRGDFESILFMENGLRFEANVLLGQKTGFFLDQRDNRGRIETLAQGRSVLNLFSFSGGFSLYAARGGASEVVNLDISQHALSAAEKNYALNRDHPSVSSCRYHAVQADAFEWLREPVDRCFDCVLLDPPALAKNKQERDAALRAYESLNAAALRRLKPGGIFISASCSAQVKDEEFFEIVTRVAQQSGNRYRDIMRTGHAEDHPASFREAHYLKAIFLEF